MSSAALAAAVVFLFCFFDPGMATQSCRKGLMKQLYILSVFSIVSFGFSVIPQKLSVSTFYKSTLHFLTLGLGGWGGGIFIYW